VTQSALFAQKFTFSQAKMGSEMLITIHAQDTTGLAESIHQAYLLTDSLILIFSDYDPQSELSNVNHAPANKPVKISRELATLLKISQKACHLSKGAFDITLGKLTKVWRLTSKAGRYTHPDTIMWYKNHTGCSQYIIDQDENTLIKKSDQFHFDLGGIAKGYIAQEISHFLGKKGWGSHLIDAGGDLVAGDAPPGDCGWKIALEIPQSEYLEKKVICIKNQAVATSGSTYQHYIKDNKVFSHIILPKTGLGINNTQNVTVITSSGTDADWLATACSILSCKKAKSLITRIPESTLIITTPENKKDRYKIYGKKTLMYHLDHPD
jgi:FAD:protein FMN transferase